MMYDRDVTETTVNGRGNPNCTSVHRPRCILSRPSCAHRLRTSMAAPGGASFGWAGFAVRPVFHPRSCAAAPIALTSAAAAQAGRRP
jgi:hypothetical protein